MENQNNKLSTFWLGFLLGSIAAGASAYLFGTKKGRETLKKILKLAENLEENLLVIGEELEEELGETGKDLKKTLMELPVKMNKENDIKKNVLGGLDGLLNKISQLSPNQEKQGKKFFIKEKTT